ncbi:MAG: hypothetical protein ACYTAF_11475, partial [Planctomycetota bacterium]
MMRRIAILLVALLLPSSLAVPQEEEKKQEPKEDKAQQELVESAKKLMGDVTKLRGLEFKKEVTVGLYTKDELRDFLVKELEKELTKEEAKKWEKSYAHFGLIPDDLDLYEAILDLHTEAVAGFYHPEEKELRLIRSKEKDPQEEMLKAQGIDMAAITLIHELTHAAQDQNYDLTTLPLDDETNDDMIMAVKAVLEGDASLVGWKFGFPKEMFGLYLRALNSSYKTGLLPGKAGELPRYLRVTLTFPYGYGTEFVMEYTDMKLEKA